MLVSCFPTATSGAGGVPFVPHFTPAAFGCLRECGVARCGSSPSTLLDRSRPRFRSPKSSGAIAPAPIRVRGRRDRSARIGRWRSREVAPHRICRLWVWVVLFTIPRWLIRSPCFGNGLFWGVARRFTSASQFSCIRSTVRRPPPLRRRHGTTLTTAHTGRHYPVPLASVALSYFFYRILIRAACGPILTTTWCRTNPLNSDCYPFSGTEKF